MAEETARANLAQSTSAEHSTRARMLCPQCGSAALYRMYRNGFMQTRIYPFLGYYPWGCKRCGVQMMLRKRRLHKARQSAS